MFAFQNLISIDRNCNVPVYLQIANCLIRQIQDGLLKSGLKLPGSRQLANDLQVHRKTIIRAIDELDAQGWVHIVKYKGTFISNQLPYTSTVAHVISSPLNHHTKARFKFNSYNYLSRPVTKENSLAFDDGFPDTRLAPLEELASTQGRLLRQSGGSSLLNYSDPLGYLKLREVLAKTFNLTRGLNITKDQLMITKGSQMALYLAASCLLEKGDAVIIGELNYQTSNLTFQHLGAELVRVPVDQGGLVTKTISSICQRRKVKAIFVTSHHHHPTTVTLTPSRRLELIELSEKYGFVIIEDDYDYEFNYGSGPLLPLASSGRNNRTIYIGSFSKSLAPAIRIGYLVGPLDFIQALGKLRRITDRQGDHIQEAAFAELLESGVIRRYHKKALKQYHIRRDHAAKLLKEKLGDLIEFEVPEGGLAFWVHFNQKYPLADLSQKAKSKGLYLSDGLFYTQNQPTMNATRMGFASMNISEMQRAVQVLSHLIKV